MKTAQDLLDSFLLEVKPPKGVSISLTEAVPTAKGDPNWVAGAGAMDLSKTGDFEKLVAHYRKSDPLVDWARVESVGNSRKRIAKWYSELN